MGTNCAPLVADLFLFCYERDFMMSLSDDKQADVIDAFNTTSRYLDVKKIKTKFLTLYWLPKLHKKPYKARFIANSSSCTTTELSKLLTSCLTAVKNMLSNIVKKYMRDPVKTYFG